MRRSLTAAAACCVFLSVPFLYAVTDAHPLPGKNSEKIRPGFLPDRGHFVEPARDMTNYQAQRRLRAQKRGEITAPKLSGIVTSFQGDAIADATILLPELNRITETDQAGHFEFSDLPEGMYHIEVYADGFMDYQHEMFRYPKTGLTLDITLIKSISEEIVVTATLTPKMYSEVPVKTQVISARQIDQKQAAHLAEAVALTTGVRVENNCQNCNFTQVRINGMEGKYSQILIDNSPVFSSMIGVYGLEQIPAEMLNRIEIIKGGGSALYGGNAVAGVINVQTQEPSENATRIRIHQEAIAGAPATNMGFRSSMVSNDGNTRGFLFANYKNRKPVDINGDDLSEIGKMRSTSFGLNFFNDFPDLKSKLKLSFYRITEDRRGGNEFGLPPHESDIAESIDSDLNGFSGEWRHYLSSLFFYSLGISYVQAKRATYYGSQQDPNAYGSTKNPMLFCHGQLNYQAGGHLLSGGIQFKRETIDDRALGYGRVINDTYHSVGVFIQDDVKFSATVSFLAGLRLSKHSLIDDLIYNPRLSLLLNLAKDLSWRTTFSTGFRAPQVFDEDLHITQVGGEGMIIENAPGLKEETSYSLSSGLDFGRMIGAGNIQLSVEGFHTLLSGTFILTENVFDPREHSLVFKRINGSKSRVYGISAELGFLFNNSFYFKTGWTFQRSLLDEAEPDFGAVDVFRSPNAYGYAMIHYDSRRWLEVDLSLEYTGSMRVPHHAGYISENRLETSTPFWILNTKFRKSLPHHGHNEFSIFAGIFNLLDDYQRDLDVGILRDAGYVYGPSKPRAFYAGFEFRF